MKTIKNEWPVWLALLAPCVFIAICWNQFPEQVPVHFNFKGKPDRYESKAFGTLLLPAINIGTYFLLLLTPYLDPSKKNYSLFEDKFKILRIAIHSFLALITFIISFYSLGYDMNITRVVLYATMVMLLVFGNYMGNIRHNYFIGIRTPWTLADEEIWLKTHRLTAKVWVAGTLIMLVLFTLFPDIPWLFFTYVSVIVVIPVVYSYLLFRKKTQHQQG